MTEPLFVEEIGPDGAARVTLTRHERHNAFNHELIVELTTALRGLGSDKRVRAIVLAAKGKSFSAGADLNWMKATAGYSRERNQADAEALAELMYTLDRLGKPTIALVQGAAYGGGVGLVACCDIAIAAERATFSLSEVRLGLIPAVISPYVVEAMGPRAARRYMLTGERFSAWEAHRLGLVHEVVVPRDLETCCQRVLDELLAGGPEAQRAAKDLIFDVDAHPLDDELRSETARRIADIRSSEEGQEGINAFLDKRRPNWVSD
jgi:methylglutaconyl-CoA hydratase